MDTNLEEENLYAKYEPLSPWAYLGYILLFAIPGINIIAIIVLAFVGQNINRKNLARAYLINVCLGFIFSIILSAIIIGIGGALFNSAKNISNDTISQIGTGLEIFNSANELTEDTVSSLDALTIQMFNNQFLSYEGDSVRGSVVKQLLTKIESINEEDSLSKITINGETEINSTSKYKISFDYDSSSGFINKVTISESN